MHRRSLPPARTIGLFARTLHRQLRQAGYDRAEVVALVNELLSLILTGEDHEPLSGVSDAETNLSNAEAVVDGLAFEMRRARELSSALLVVVIEIAPPDWCTDDAAWTLHARVAKQLRRGVRPTDIVGRLATTRYALVLPGATRAAAGEIVVRLIQPILNPRRSEDRPPDGTRVSVSVVADDGSDETATALLARCAAEPPESISTDARPLRRPTSYPPPKVEEGFVLALGGGAARAAAHIGVLRTLERDGLEISAIAGTSAGALVGAMYLSGMKPAQILERFEAFTHSEVYKKMRRNYVRHRRETDVSRSAAKLFRHTGVALLSRTSVAVIDDELFGAFIEFFVGPDRDLSTMSAPFAAVSTDLVEGRPVWITSGPLHLALRASCALPGLFPPLREGNRVLVDGAVLAEVPVAAARQLGGGARVLAVHLARPDHPDGLFASSEELVVRASAMAHKELVREQLCNAELLLTAHVGEIGWLDFRRAANTASIGEAAARAFLDARAKRAARDEAVQPLSIDGPKSLVDRYGAKPLRDR